VRLDRINLVVPVLLTREHDQVTARRPQREVVVAAGDRCDLLGLDVHDAKTTVAPGPKRPIDEAAPVWRHRWKGAVVRTRGELAVPTAVRVNHRDLRAALDSILRLEEDAMKAVEEGIEDADAEQDLVAHR